MCHALIARRANLPQPDGIAVTPKSASEFAASRPEKRGVSRSSRTLGAGCDGRDGLVRRTRPTRTAKPCGPGAPTLASSFAEFSAKRRWQESPVTGESTEHAVKTIAQGRPGKPGVPVVTMLVCFLISHARLRVRRAPGFPCALFYQRDKMSASLGREQASRDRGRAPRTP
jgi:hypothetical protein